MRAAPVSDRPFHLVGRRPGPLGIITPRDGAVITGRGWPGMLRLSEMPPGASGEGVVVGIVGSGIDAHHPAYRTRVIRARTFGGGPRDGWDIHGHGTHLAGVVAAGRDAASGRGIAPDATLAAASVVDVDGRGRGRHVADAVSWLASVGASVVVMGVDAAGPDPVVESAIADACQGGVIVVRPPRSRRAGQPHPPGDASSRRVVVAGACDTTGRVGLHPQGWADVDVVYPGMTVLSSYPGGRIATWSHPVVAAAGVAGALACIISRIERDMPTAPTDLVVRTLTGSCRVYAQPGDRGECGHGVPILADVLSGRGPSDLGRGPSLAQQRQASEQSGRGRPGGAPARPYDPHRRWDRPAR